MRFPVTILALSVACVSPTFGQEESPKQIIDRLHAAPKPEGQKQLDTLALASARREKTDSMVERTNGLWQSWVVAICQGCGVKERRYSAEDEKALEDRAGWRSRTASKKEVVVRQANASKIVIRPVAMLEERKPAIVMIGARGVDP